MTTANALTYTAPGTITRCELNGELFASYVSYIDRSERTAKTYLTNLRQFAAWLKYERITQPARADIMAYRDYLLAEHKAIQLDSESVNGWRYRTDGNGNAVIVKCRATTAKGYLQAVCRFFRWTASEGLYPNIADNIHAPKVKTDTHRKAALTAENVYTIEQSILAEAVSKTNEAMRATKDRLGKTARATEQGARLYAIYLLAVNAGLRTIELSRANVKDIEVENGTAYIYIYGKGHSEADTKKALASEVKQAIDNYLSLRADNFSGNSPLFVSTGNRSRGKRIATTTISTMLKKMLVNAGFNSERYTAHSLRHTTGTAIQELTGNLYTTQQYMRHANPATTEIYLHNDTVKAEAETAQRLYAMFHGKTSDNDAEKLASITATMTPDQIAKLLGVAEAMAK